MIPLEDAAVRLPLEFDAERLQADLARAEGIERANQPGPYHDGSWTGLALYQAGGEQTAMPEFAGLRPYSPTALLEASPYLKEVVDALPARKNVVRLLWLPPGKSIGPHYDFDCSFRYGVLRLHIPIVTHPDVEFRIAGHRMSWGIGEVWYGDFSAEHWVDNKSDVARVHMVADVEVSPAILALFPADFVERREREGISRQIEYVELPAAARARLACHFHVPGSLLPLLKYGTLPELIRGAEARVVDSGKELRVEFDRVPAFALDAISETEFVVRGLPSGVQFHFDLERNERVTGVRLVTRSVPTNLICARIGKLTEDTDFPDRETPLELVSGT